MSKSKGIAEHAAALMAQPGDFDAWWALALALASDGPKKRAARAFFELGEAASRRGMVGLAVACVIQTKKFETTLSARLSRSIADRHAHGKRSRGRHTAPPMPPPNSAESDSPTDDLPEKRQAALKLASAAISRAKELAVERSAESLPSQHFARALKPDDFVGLMTAATLVHYKADAQIIERGADAKTLYWIARGSAIAIREGSILGELRSNMFFGEIALLSGTTRTASVIAAEPSWLLELPADSLERLSASSPDLATVLAHYARRRLLTNVMTTSPLFTQLSTEEQTELLREFKPRVLETNEALISLGAANDHLFVIVSGIFKVRREDEVITTLLCGDAVGEKSVLSRTEADADVVATEPGVVLGLARDRFNVVALRHPELLAEVYKLLVERETEQIVHDAAELVI